MKIAIDGKSLSGPPGGVRRYVLGVLRGLDCLDGAPAPEVLEPARRTGTVAWTLLGLQRATVRGLDLLHCPFYYTPLAPRCPVTVAIHDVLPLERPDWFPRSWLSPIRWLMGPSARRAAGIVTFASSTAEAIARRFAVPTSRIRVIPHGVDHDLFAPPPAEMAGSARDRWADGRPYVLQVGALEPRRGVDLTIRAVGAVRSRFPDLVLLLAGPERFTVPELSAAPPWVVRTGPVPDADLPALYAGAEAVLSPSRGEGFDLPLLEALACGATVVASDIPVHVEHFGAAVRLFPSGDAEGLAAALAAVVGGDPAVSELRRRAIELAERFTWERSARRHLALWREILETGGAGSPPAPLA